jgi:hypothetical protein
VKTLSVIQPWASLIMMGAKGNETRPWATAYRGIIAIHASKGFPLWAQELCCEQPFQHALRAISWGYPDGKHYAHDLPLGCVLGTVELVDVYCITPNNLPPEPERSFGDYRPGRQAWVLRNPTPFPYPIPARGKLGLWEWQYPAVLEQQP